ncbi:MAG TPA: DNA methyltransferase [Alphaproteobacteria bacterium]|nr:DNA methyltransferase [Alphaproteobacteria bacterium]
MNPLTQNAQVVAQPVATLKPYANNPRKHSKAQVRQIAASIEAFGFTNPVLVDAEGTILAGHGRVEAAKLLKLAEVPTLRIDHLTEAQKKAYIIADNRLAERSGWDDDILAIELQTLMTMEAPFDLTVTGFEMAEIDLKVQGIDDPDMDGDDEQPEVSAQPVSRTGDRWLLGDHVLVCGDALSPDAYGLLMNGEQARMVITDPPYNVAIPGNVSGKGKVVHEDFAMASGEMTEVEFAAFLTTACGQMANNSSDGSIHFIFMDWRHIDTLLAAGKGVYTELKNLVVWNKDNGGMGHLYRSKHELVAVFKHGTAGHVNNVALGRHGRYRTNVWNYPGVNTLRAGREEELAMHPTVKPVRLLADAMMDCSDRGDLVLDPFAGSGSTIIAAERTGRRARAIELEPKYVDVAIARWQALTGREAVHADTGLTFDATKQAKE